MLGRELAVDVGEPGSDAVLAPFEGLQVDRVGDVRGDEQTDPAAQLTTMLDQATSQLTPGKNRRSRVTGLIATPAEPITDAMRTPLDERQVLVEARAMQLVRDGQDGEAVWISRLGKPPTEVESASTLANRGSHYRALPGTARSSVARYRWAMARASTPPSSGLTPVLGPGSFC